MIKVSSLQGPHYRSPTEALEYVLFLVGAPLANGKSLRQDFHWDRRFHSQTAALWCDLVRDVEQEMVKHWTNKCWSKTLVDI